MEPPRSPLFVAVGASLLFLAACSAPVRRAEIPPAGTECEAPPEPRPSADPDKCPAPPPGGIGQVIAVAAGQTHTCALTMDGEVWCWGSDGTDVVDTHTPRKVDGLDAAVDIAAGGRGTCIIDMDDRLVCWGAGLAPKPTPNPAAATPVRAVSMGGDGERATGCLLSGEGSATCWGAASPAPALGSGLRAVAAGPARACAITPERRLDCWDAAGDGKPRGDLEAVVGVAATTNRTCVLVHGGRVDCWTPGAAPETVYDAEDRAAVLVAGGGRHCLVTAAGALRCWGGDVAAPTPVAGLEGGVVAAAVGGAHTCAVLRAGGVRCWGANGRGQLGVGTTVDSPKPLPVVGF